MPTSKKLQALSYLEMIYFMWFWFNLWFGFYFIKFCMFSSGGYIYKKYNETHFYLQWRYACKPNLTQRIIDSQALTAVHASKHKQCNKHRSCDPLVPVWGGTDQKVRSSAASLWNLLAFNGFCGLYCLHMKYSWFESSSLKSTLLSFVLKYPSKHWSLITLLPSLVNYIDVS